MQDSMLPRKRSRDVRDLDGEVYVQVESASSSFQSRASQKRSRLALAAQQGGSVVSDEDDDDDDDDNGRDIAELDAALGEHSDDNASTIAPSELRSDDDDEDEDDDDDDDAVYATQQVHRHFNEQRENIASEQGIIEEVFCRNFMCHAKLRIRLGPLINFIIGHNGSGKSAVLTALTMCLGGKATSTNRGASLKSLIKEGEETATLAVKIKNQGEGAYKHEIYGDSITVERNFSRNGTSGFKIRNSEDKVISTKKADLDDISDFYAFQLDNPINVLNQDMARQFLSNSSAGDKYKFFIRGTQLETLDTDYRILEEHIDTIQDKLRARKSDVELLEQKAQEADAKRRRLLEAGALQEKIVHCRRMHAWAQVEEQEAILAQVSQEIEHGERKVSEKEQVGVDKAAEFEGRDQSAASAASQIDVFREQLQPVQTERAQLKDEFDKNREALMNERGEQRKIKEDLKRHQRNIDDLNAKIRDEQTRLAEFEGEEQTDRLRQLDEVKSRAEDAKSAYEQHGNENELVRRKGDAEKDVQQAKTDVDEKKSQLERAESQLRSVQGSEGRPLDGYHNAMGNLVRAVEQETRWRERPVGPMGKHIRLLNLDWQPQLERILNDLLPAFAVTNKEDRDLLGVIMKRVGCVQTIYTGSSRPLDTRANEPREGITTILRVLRIDSEIVRNQLIINQSIEQMALTPVKRDAEEMISGPTRVANVRAAIAYGADRSVGIRFETTRTGNLKTTPVGRFNGRTRMRTDRENQIRVERERVEAAKEQYNAAENARLQRRTALERANQDLSRFRREKKEMKIAMQEAEDLVQQLQQEVDDHVPQDGRLQELERQIQEAREELESARRSFQDSVISTDTLGEKNQGLKARLDEAQAKVVEGEAKIQRATVHSQNAQSSRLEALLAKNEALQAIDDAKREVQRIRDRREEQQVNVQEFIEGASQICERVAVEDGVDCATLEVRIETLTRQYQQREREAGGNREQLTRAWSKATKEYKLALKQMKDMSALHKTLIRTLAERKYRWRKFRKHIAARARNTFQYLLSERKFRGRLLVDHLARELDIKVEPDMGKSSDAGRESRTLSGGEKSFSTICLLLSIWEAMGSPIRCLDEFDVFMDSVNRQASMTMMIGAARRAVGRQFILITPQAMNNVTMGQDVRIYRMSDPERGQTTLPFTQH